MQPPWNYEWPTPVLVTSDPPNGVRNGSDLGQFGVWGLKSGGPDLEILRSETPDFGGLDPKMDHFGCPNMGF